MLIIFIGSNNIVSYKHIQIQKKKKNHQLKRCTNSAGCQELQREDVTEKNDQTTQVALHKGKLHRAFL